MAINIKNREVESLLDELIQITGETKTEAVRKALAERKQRLSLGLSSEAKAKRVQAFLEEEVWPLVPPELLGKGISKQEEEEILGFGKHGE